MHVHVAWCLLSVPCNISALLGFFGSLRIRLGGKQIANPDLREDVARMDRIMFQLASQSVDVHLQHSEPFEHAPKVVGPLRRFLLHLGTAHSVPQQEDLEVHSFL